MQKMLKRCKWTLGLREGKEFNLLKIIKEDFMTKMEADKNLKRKARIWTKWKAEEIPDKHSAILHIYRQHHQPEA